MATFWKHLEMERGATALSKLKSKVSLVKWQRQKAIKFNHIKFHSSFGLGRAATHAQKNGKSNRNFIPKIVFGFSRLCEVVVQIAPENRHAILLVRTGKTAKTQQLLWIPELIKSLTPQCDSAGYHLQSPEETLLLNNHYHWRSGFT